MFSFFCISSLRLCPFSFCHFTALQESARSCLATRVSSNEVNLGDTIEMQGACKLQPPRLIQPKTAALVADPHSITVKLLKIVDKASANLVVPFCLGL